MQELLVELTNYQNGILMLLTWAIVEMMSPLSRMVVMRFRGSARLRLHQLQKHGKRVAGVVWISVLVWVPYAQPSLCEGPPVEGCQTVFARVSLGVILGVLLSSSHWAGAKMLRRITGSKKKVRVACANCGKKYETESWDDACPKCKETPHEVTKLSQ